MAGLILSVVIVTYNREQVLLDTIRDLLPQAQACPGFDELIVVDQTARHEAATHDALSRWHEQGAIRWLRLPAPDLTGAMNRGLLEAKSDLVLYLDDDIVPAPGLLAGHLAAHAERAPWVVVGQVLQPGQVAEAVPYAPSGGTLRRYMDFPFRGTEGSFIENAMAGNMSVRRGRALASGGFDENFRPPVASRFESEFAKRVVAAGGTIWFEPRASIRHLQVSSGGTRSRGTHLASADPCFGVGDYYFALRHGRGWERLSYVLRKPFREVRTRFHLRHPWWIPPKLVGEARAFTQALALVRKPPALLAAGAGASREKDVEAT
jgi:glycosyltransferase involved in cell wall biosynthesis